LLAREVGASAEAAFLRSLRAGFLTPADLGPADLERATELVERYAGLPLGGTDACVVAVAERHGMTDVGSGVDASQTGTGKTITSGRALAHRASTTRRFRGMVVAEGRLLGQWRDELLHGAPARGLPPLAPNVDVLVLSEHGPIAGRLRGFDRRLGDRPGVALVANGVLDRHPGELAALDWHLLIADEALRYANPATEAHQALAQLQTSSVADCWLLTATPRGKDSEQLDVLVGLALGDETMIRERLNTREAGDLLDELNAHRLRVNYGPHLVRVTRQDMQAWMPEVRPAQPLALEADTALTELLEAIRQGGREAYRRLLELLRELRELEPGSPVYKQALADLARVQGVALGNVGVFVDPETLTHSRAALAQALTRQGVVAEAMRGGDGLPLLRGVTAQTLAGIAGEEQVLVFAERVRCLRQLAATLRERHGVEAHVADGSLASREFEALNTASPPVSSRSCASHASARRATTCRTRPWSATSTCRGCPPGSNSASGARLGRAPFVGGRPTSPTSAMRASRTSSRSSPRAAANTTRCSTPMRASAPPTRPWPRNSGRSPARSPNTRTRPATPERRQSCASLRACSASADPARRRRYHARATAPSYGRPTCHVSSAFADAAEPRRAKPSMR
jgi:hypothetical protein